MPFEERQIKLGHEVVEITSPEMANEIVTNKSLRSRMSVGDREKVRQIGDKIEQDWAEGRV